jgi:hypothetical protein
MRKRASFFLRKSLIPRRRFSGTDQDALREGGGWFALSRTCLIFLSALRCNDNENDEVAYVQTGDFAGFCADVGRFHPFRSGDYYRRALS